MAYAALTKPGAGPWPGRWSPPPSSSIRKIPKGLNDPSRSTRKHARSLCQHHGVGANWRRHRRGRGNRPRQYSAATFSAMAEAFIAREAPTSPWWTATVRRNFPAASNHCRGDARSCRSPPPRSSPRSHATVSWWRSTRNFPATALRHKGYGTASMSGPQSPRTLHPPSQQLCAGCHNCCAR